MGVFSTMAIANWQSRLRRRFNKGWPELNRAIRGKPVVERGT
jgi:hypothetical protein